eukprot:1230449-Rhodomonas_salina.2
MGCFNFGVVGYDQLPANLVGYWDGVERLIPVCPASAAQHEPGNRVALTRCGGGAPALCGLFDSGWLARLLPVQGHLAHVAGRQPARTPDNAHLQHPAAMPCSALLRLVLCGATRSS